MHKKGQGPSLTCRTDYSNASPTASVITREGTALWFKKITAIRYPNGYIQVRSAASSYNFTSRFRKRQTFIDTTNVIREAFKNNQ